MLFGEPEVVVVDHPKFLWSDELIGQQTLTEHVKTVLSQDRFPHCSLISGSPGSGQLVLHYRSFRPCCVLRRTNLAESVVHVIKWAD